MKPIPYSPTIPSEPERPRSIQGPLKKQFREYFPYPHIHALHLIALAGFSLTLLSFPAHADTTKQDIQAVEKALRKAPAAVPPAVGTRFVVDSTMAYTQSMAATAEGEKIEPRESTGHGHNQYEVGILELRDGKVCRVRFTPRTLDFKESTPEDMDEAKPEKDQPNPVAGVLSRTFVASIHTGDESGIKVEDSEGNQVPDETLKLLLIPLPRAFDELDLGIALFQKEPSPLFDEGQGFLPYLPWKEPPAPGKSVPLPSAVASEMVRPGNGWEASSIHRAEVEAGAEEVIDGVPCIRLRLTVEGKGPHRERFGGLPTNSTIILRGSFLIEKDSGWLRELDLHHETISESNGSFQEVKMTMSARSSVHYKTTVTVHRP